MAQIPTGSIPGPPEGWPEKFKADDLVEFGNPLIEETAKWWTEHFVINGAPMFPRDLASRLVEGLPGQPKCFISSVAPGFGRVSVELQGLDSSASQVWFHGHTIGFVPDRRIFSDLIVVSDAQQGQGVAKRIMTNCYGVAMDLQLDRLELKASWIGAYTWLRFGFVPSSEDWEGPLKAHVIERLFGLKQVINSKKFNESLRILSSDEPRAAWILADDDTQIPASSRPLTLGQALFADCGATWYGKIEFDDEEAVGRFEDYVEWKG